MAEETTKQTTPKIQLTGEVLKPQQPRIFTENADEAAKFDALLDDVLINPIQPIPEPETLLSLNDTPILWRGCKSFVCAVAKARKTTALTLFGAMLTGKDETANGFKAKPECKVLFIDTEQARYDSQKIFYRVAALTGLSHERLLSRFQVLSLNKNSYEEIKGLMEAAIIRFKPDVVMLDNWTDCVVSVLDEKDCTKFSKDLRAVAEVYNLAIFSVIHANEGESKTEQPRFRGWAIEEARKSDLTLYLKDMSESPIEELRGEYSRARFGKCRGKKPDEFGVAIDETGLPYIYKHVVEEIKNPDKYAPFVAVIPKAGLSYSNLLQKIREIAPEIENKEMSISTAKRRVGELLCLGLIVKRGSGQEARYYKPEEVRETPDLPF